MRFLNLNHNLIKDLVKVPQHGKIQIVSTLDNPIVTNIRAELQLKSVFPNAQSINNRQVSNLVIPHDQFLKTYFDVLESSTTRSGKFRLNGKYGQCEFVYASNECEEQAEVLFSSSFPELQAQFYCCKNGASKRMELNDEQYLKIPQGSAGGVLVACVKTDDGYIIVKSLEI